MFRLQLGAQFRQSNVLLVQLVFQRLIERLDNIPRCFHGIAGSRRSCVFGFLSRLDLFVFDIVHGGIDEIFLILQRLYIHQLRTKVLESPIASVTTIGQAGRGILNRYFSKASTKREIILLEKCTRSFNLHSSCSLSQLANCFRKYSAVSDTEAIYISMPVNNY